MSATMEHGAASVRPAREGDWPVIEELLRDGTLPTAGAQEHLGDFLVAEGGGSVVGVIGLERYADGALLRSAAVAPAWRGHGVGEALVRALLAHARGRGVASLFLLTETAERWFPRFGFARVTREDVPAGVKASVEFRGACPASAAVFRRDLAPADDPLPSWPGGQTKRDGGA